MASYWRNWSVWLFSWIEGSRHAPVLILLGKGWKFSAANPIIQIQMILISAVWIIRAFNIAFSSVVNVTIDSAITTGRWILVVVGDFFEGAPVGRMITIALFLYLRMVALGGCFYFMGSLFVSVVCRCGYLLKCLISWRCGSRIRQTQPVSRQEIAPTPQKTANGPTSPKCKNPVVVQPISAESTRVPEVNIPSLELADNERVPNDVTVASGPLHSPVSGTPAFAQEITEDDPSASRKSKGLRISVDSQSDSNSACQARLISSIESPDVLSSSPCHGKRIKLPQLLSDDGAIQGGKAANGGNGRMALLCGKHRGVFYSHRDAHKFQRQDCCETGIILKIESVGIQECRPHIQERLNGVAALPSTDASRAPRSYRREREHSVSNEYSGR